MLHELQHLLAQGAILGDSSRDATEIVEGDRNEAHERLAVYRNTFLGTLTNALRLNFPATERLLGRDFFAGAAVRFAVAHPPRSACLNDYGAGFPAFLDALPQAAHLSYVPGVARLDWAYAQALCAPDAALIDISALAGEAAAITAETRLTLHPALAILVEEWPVDAIWHATLAADEEALAAIELMHAKRFILVERPDLEVRVETIDETDAALLGALLEGQPLGAIIDRFGETEATTRFATHLAKGRLIWFHAQTMKRTER